jgi:ZIP family zinc transporter
MQSIEIGYILALAAASATVLGWVVMRFKSNPSERLIAYIFLFVAIAMIFVDLVQLIPTALDSGLAQIQVLIYLIAGFSLILLISKLLSLKFGNGPSSSALVIAFALSLHNLPEGSAPIAASLVDLPTGVTTAVLMALHNIPEGIAITASAILAGYGRIKSLLLTLTATLAEMLGATAVFLSDDLFTNIQNAGALLSFVAGIMLAICVKELLPFSIKTLRPSSRK